jgi:hypothetical protein
MQSKNTRLGRRASGTTVDELRNEFNTILDDISGLLDQDASVRGTATFHGPVDFQGNQGLRLGRATKSDDVVRFDQLTAEIQRLEDRIMQLERLLGGGGNLFVSTATPIQIDAGDVGSAGSGLGVSAATHEHPLNTSLAAVIQPTGNAAGAGTGVTIPRGDHVHQLRAPVIATGSLPAAGAGEDGRVIIEDVAAGDRNIIIYAGAQRFRIDGGAAI